MKKIKLHSKKYRNIFTLVDDEDYVKLKGFHWGIFKSKNSFYVGISRKGKKLILMHRIIISPTKEQHVDHKDRNGLNNQKENLRCCNRSQNAANRDKHSNNTTGLKGVIAHNNSFRAKFRGKIIGQYPTKTEAARSYDEAAIKHFGEFACTNYSLGLL